MTPIVETMPADLLTPLGVFLALSADAKNCFLLESVEGGETLARYSFIGAEPEMVVRGNGERTTVRDGSGLQTTELSAFEYLREHFSAIAAERPADLPSFIGGAIGYLDFSCVEWFEPTLKRSRPNAGDQAAFMFFRSIVAFDHAKQVVKIISLVFDSEDTDRAAEAAHQRNARVSRNA